MITPKEKKHLHQIIAVCFVTNFILGIIPGFFSDISTANANMTAKYFWQIANLFYMVGRCLYSLKAGSEDKLITAGGFIVLSIGIGTLFAFVLVCGGVLMIHYDRHSRKYEEGARKRFPDPKFKVPYRDYSPKTSFTDY